MFLSCEPFLRATIVLESFLVFLTSVFLPSFCVKHFSFLSNQLILISALWSTNFPFFSSVSHFNRVSHVSFLASHFSFLSKHQGFISLASSISRFSRINYCTSHFSSLVNHFFFFLPSQSAISRFSQVDH